MCTCRGPVTTPRSRERAELAGQHDCTPPPLSRSALSLPGPRPTPTRQGSPSVLTETPRVERSKTKPTLAILLEAEGSKGPCRLGPQELGFPERCRLKNVV